MLNKKLLITITILCITFIAICDEEYGILSNKPTPPENYVFVSIKNPQKEKNYKIMRGGECIATLSVVSVVGDFGAVMKVNDSDSISSIMKGDRVYIYNGKSEKVSELKNKQITYANNETDIIVPPNKISEQKDKKTSETVVNNPENNPAEQKNTQNPVSQTITLVNSQSQQPAQTVQGGSDSNSKVEIVLDEQDGDTLFLNPPKGWKLCRNVKSSYNSSSILSSLSEGSKQATWHCQIPQDGTYNVSLWWVNSTDPNDLRANNLKIVVHSSDGDIPLTIDQTKDGGQFNSIMNCKFKAGHDVKILTITNKDMQNPGGFMSVDALKLTLK